MDVKSFLKGVLSGEGHYCVFASRTSDDRRTQKFYDSIYQVIDAAENLDAEGYDAYYALATFNEAGSRKVDNVKHLNALFLDLDCGASKDYATQADAISALRAFCGKLSLPKPVMVNSGRGVHVYWMLDAPVCLDDWLPVAERLKKRLKIIEQERYISSQPPKIRGGMIVVPKGLIAKVLPGTVPRHCQGLLLAPQPR